MSFLGGTVEKEATFRDTTGALADPAVVAGTARKPSGVAQAAVVVQQSTGVYDLLFENVDVVGMWYYRITGSGGGVDAVTEGSFRVRGSSV